MKTLNLKRSKIVSLFLIAIMIVACIPNISAHANETDDSVEYELLDENDEYYQEALDVLCLSKEEAVECNIYSVDVPLTPVVNGISIPNNSGYYYFNEFTFYDSNNGSYWTCNGSKLKWGFTWKSGNSTYKSMQYLYVRLSQYPAYDYNDMVDESGYKYNEAGYTSSWISVNKCDHRFTYSTGYTGLYSTAYATVKVFVATKN